MKILIATFAGPSHLPSQVQPSRGDVTAAKTEGAEGSCDQQCTEKEKEEGGGFVARDVSDSAGLLKNKRSSTR